MAGDEILRQFCDTVCKHVLCTRSIMYCIKQDPVPTAGKTDKVANFPGQDMHKVVIGNHVNT